MSEPCDELTEGWPADPENDELARFAEELGASLPELPAAALARVEQRVGAAAAARLKWRARRVAYAVAALAAVALLAVALWRGLFVAPPPAPAPPHDPAPRQAQGDPPAPVHDISAIEVAGPPPPPPAQPPLRLDAHQTLFTE